MIYIGAIAIIVSAVVARVLVEHLLKRREPKGLHSEKTIIGNGWGIYDGEFVEGRYDI